MSNNFKTNLSSCVICLVIAREIFLLKSDCSVITKVHKLNFSLLSLTYFAKDEQTLKMEDTLYKMDIFRHRPICGLFPLKCQSLRQTFQRIIQALLLAKHLRRFCCFCSCFFFFFGCIYELVHVVVVTCNTFVSVNFEINLKNRLYNEHYPSILVTFLGRPSILVGKH